MVGYGSIGSRHAAILREKGQTVACVTSRTDVPFPVFSTLEAALREFAPHRVIIANITVNHYSALLAIEKAAYRGPVLVEKPLFASVPAIVPTFSFQVLTAYNLRFHPLLLRIRELLCGRRVYSAQMSVGQYLPTWRLGADYRKSYSASAKLGGGVLRDLSHELDLALWLFGPWMEITARIGRWGDLEIDSADCADILACMGNCASLSMHLDYQNLFPFRHIAIQAEGLSLAGDLLAGILRTDRNEEHFVVERDTTYAAQLEAFLQGKFERMCSWLEGLAVLHFIEGLERCATRRQWERKA